MIFGREPTLILALIRAVLVCATLFGLALSEEQFAAVYLVFELTVALVNRAQVTPVADPRVGARRI